MTSRSNHHRKRNNAAIEQISSIKAIRRLEKGYENVIVDPIAIRVSSDCEDGDRGGVETFTENPEIYNPIGRIIVTSTFNKHEIRKMARRRDPEVVSPAA